MDEEIHYHEQQRCGPHPQSPPEQACEQLYAPNSEFDCRDAIGMPGWRECKHFI
jgi:hypothetical protein